MRVGWLISSRNMFFGEKNQTLESEVVFSIPTSFLRHLWSVNSNSLAIGDGNII